MKNLEVSFVSKVAPSEKLGHRLATGLLLGYFSGLALGPVIPGFWITKDTIEKRGINGKNTLDYGFFKTGVLIANAGKIGYLVQEYFPYFEKYFHHLVK